MPETPDYGLLDRSGIARTIFFPRPDHSRAPAGAEDLAFEIEPGVALGARLYTASPASPTILYFHGNGEVVGDHDGVADYYHEAGANLLVVDFRGYGRSGGRPTFANLVADGPRVAAQFHALLDSRGYSPRRFVMGRSLGAHPAVEIAAHAPEGFAGLIVESGATVFRRFLDRAGLAGADEGRRLNDAHEAKIRAIRLPVLVLHGEWDELIPLTSAQDFVALLGETRVEFVVIPGAGHNDILFTGLEDYFNAIGEFLRTA